MSADTQSNGSSIKKLLLTVTVLLIIMSLFIPAEWYKSNMVSELKMGELITGKSGFHSQILSFANELYNDFFVQTGINSALTNYYAPLPVSVDPLEQTFNNISGIFYPFFINLAKMINYHNYMIVYRMALLSFWLPFFCIILVPSLIAGVCRWKRKQYDFSYVSPFLNRRSMKLIGLTVFLVAVSILIPLPVPPVINAVMTLFVIPTSIILMISNLPKQI